MRSIFARLLFQVFSYLPVGFRLWLWKKLVSIGVKRYPDHTGSTTCKVPFGLYVKYRGRNVRPQEGYATIYLQSHTDIPVPTVVDIVVHKGETILVMTEMPGNTLDIDRLWSLSDAEVEKFATQLKRHLNQLRALPPPDDSVCGFMHNPIFDLRVAFSGCSYGPFDSIAAFHECLLSQELKIPPDQQVDVLRRIHASHSRPHRLCLTHADLHSENIMVDDDLNITAILDWECAGWFPEYWEYTKARFVVNYRNNPNWKKILSIALAPYLAEYEADMLLISYRQIY